MARDQVDMTPVETREELIAWFEAGSKPKSQFRIGTEHEKFVFTVEGHNPVPYDGSRSIRALLKGMQHLCVPKIRFCNIGDEDRRGQAVM